MEENKINIAAILKDKPKGTKLWSPIVGNGTFKGFSSKIGAIVVSFIDKDGEQLGWVFNEYGKTLSAQKEAEVCLFPSKQMRDWEKFAWQKGDVLDSNDGFRTCLFCCWKDDTYTCFYGKYLYCPAQGDEEDVWQYRVVCNTADYYKSKAPDSFIELLEKNEGGKLNLETLEIERGVKDELIGEFCYFEGKGLCFVSTLEKVNVDTFEFGDCVSWKDGEPDKKEYSIKFSEPVKKEDLTVLRLATKREIYEYIRTKGRKVFKTFDKVLVRGDDEGKDDAWIPAFFIMMDGNDERSPYYCKSLEAETAELYKQCIPYEGNEHLAFTTYDFQG